MGRRWWLDGVVRRSVWWGGVGVGVLTVVVGLTEVGRREGRNRGEDS